MNERHAVSELFLISLHRWIDAAPDDIEVDVAICYTHDESAELCKRYDEYDLCYAANISAGYKWNAAQKHVMGAEWHYLFIIGDDDIMSNDVWSYYDDQLWIGNPFFGLRSEYFYEPSTDRAMRFQYPFDKMLGGGRFISREAVEKVGSLWDMDKKTGLDQCTDDKLKAININPYIIDTPNPMILDIKTKHNIWSFNSYQAFGKPCTTDEALSFMTEQEINKLKTIK